jgi:alpha-glucuronidase
MLKTITLFLLVLLSSYAAQAEDGYRLWLRYDKITNPAVLQAYSKNITGLYLPLSSPVLKAAALELTNGLGGLLGKTPRNLSAVIPGALAALPASHVLVRSLMDEKELNKLGEEGFIIRRVHQGGKEFTLVTGNSDVAVLYGSFHFLRLLQTGQSIQSLSITSIPRIKRRVLNHWDNLNRHVERGYAGISIWNWHTLPGYIDQRYVDYARANASVGINGTVLTNVNANAVVLQPEYLKKCAALANTFRPYGIKVYLTARFSAPVETGGLKTADPLDPAVKEWWTNKVKEIYSYIPDFGGFLVKANSEGQPGPQNYGRNHAHGANMLADAVAPHGGIVMWRAFVYSNETPEDRFKQAYNEFQPLDGTFRKNVLVQVKNGPVDFQPREPFHPLFGAMPKTPLMMEFQLTQEYLGFATHLVYLPPMFKEVLKADTYRNGAGSQVSKVIDGSLHGHELSGMAGVANIGNDRNWTGHPFGQSNWYAFGRLAWDHSLTSASIAEEWIRQSFSNDKTVIEPVKRIMLSSHESLVKYMTPLGLHHIMGYGHHYGPAPWYNAAPRADWNPVYFHKADSSGIGFDRTEKGSGALAQYAPEVRQQWNSIGATPDKWLLWFHHVPWNHKMKSGRNLWEELCYQYQSGVDSVRRMRTAWDGLQGKIDSERFNQVSMLLSIQEEEARWWRDACLLYFQTFSRMPFPEGWEAPGHTLEYYMKLRFPYAPGNG